jgi:hypothetical protein
MRAKISALINLHSYEISERVACYTFRYPVVTTYLKLDTTSHSVGITWSQECEDDDNPCLRPALLGKGGLQCLLDL